MNFRNLVVGVNTLVPLKNGKLTRYINFDNAATTPPFYSVMQSINQFAPWYSSIHRGNGYKSVLSTEIYETSRKKVMEFVGADPMMDTVIYVKNTTEAINKLANRLCKDDKCVILSTLMEHHSNDLPWREKFFVDYVETDNCGKLSLEDLEMKLKKYEGKVKLVTVTGASNVTGYVNPYYKIAKLAHKYGAMILVDGAQLIPHKKFDMKPHFSNEHIDFVAFSGHKMYAPFGIGALVGHKKVFEKGEPDYKGGGTVKLVSQEFVIWEDPPYKEEAGTPNLMGVIALVSAIETLQKIGMDKIEEYENSLLEYANQRLSQIPEVELYCSKTYDRVSIIPFNIKNLHHSKVAQILSEYFGIAVRSGCFCAQPYIQRLLKINKEKILEFAKNPNLERPGMVRLSFGLYNTFDEIDTLIKAIKIIIKNY
ncbi:Selenocysteine lyase/Cysteine desulfurase [Caloramator fervidus]|uniref:Selenocysteine lyase/Cysteine desulfurase n=1 Tax=Caloramator fervidus TaxID=29344 RepID=A0A1H5VKR3_9CLOT|nr:aminotransferase class V-fold PLP-dependent enzyme [Caloramator fervidus]SEF87421.1 Selenocysteine lyase/Cysteine desulfurase [Caloramator fervidus]